MHAICKHINDILAGGTEKSENTFKLLAVALRSCWFREVVAVWLYKMGPLLVIHVFLTPINGQNTWVTGV